MVLKGEMMVARSSTVSRPPQQRGSTSTDEGSEGQSSPAELSAADLKELADKVYDLLLEDLLRERERGLW